MFRLYIIDLNNLLFPNGKQSTTIVMFLCTCTVFLKATAMYRTIGQVYTLNVMGY